jgi:hypothetical protein
LFAYLMAALVLFLCLSLAFLLLFREKLLLPELFGVINYLVLRVPV